VGIGAAGPISHAAAVSWRLLASAVLGLAVAAALWWLVFGGGDEERAERALSEAGSKKRTQLALTALFYGNIPLLLGLVAVAAAILRAVVSAAGQPAAASVLGMTAGHDMAIRTGQAAVLALGAALFLGGDVAIRRILATGPVRLRAAAAVVALATTAVGATAGLDAQLAVVAAVLILPLVAERDSRGAGGRSGPARPAGGDSAGADAAG
jgi:low temperature requirement protein LtrA